MKKDMESVVLFPSLLAYESYSLIMLIIFPSSSYVLNIYVLWKDGTENKKTKYVRKHVNEANWIIRI